MMSGDRQALEELVIDNAELERLEALLDEFNIFEVMGAVKVELRHSEFLAYLMDPNRNHGLGEDFVKKFLQKALVGIDQSELPFTAIDLDIWDLDDLEVRREWNNIDILLLSEENKLAVVIENKIRSSEHSNQLDRYWKAVSQHYPGWKILGLFLTPEGDEPSDENYLSVSYELICEILENFINTRQGTLGPDILTTIKHYTEMLRRNIVSGSEIEELAQKIYKKHQRALDIIYEYRPDMQSAVYEYLLELVKGTEGLVLDHSTKSKVRFTPAEWNSPAILSSDGHKNIEKILIFEFKNDVDRLKLFLIIFPGPVEIRQKLFEVAKGKNPPLKSQFQDLGKKYSTIYVNDYLKPVDYEGASIGDLVEIIQKQWTVFTEKHLPKIKDIFEKETWLWED